MTKKHVSVRLDDDSRQIIDDIQKHMESIGIKVSKADAISFALKNYAVQNNLGIGDKED